MWGSEEKHPVWGNDKDRNFNKSADLCKCKFTSNLPRKFLPHLLALPRESGAKICRGDMLTLLLENLPDNFLACSCAAAAGYRLGPCTACLLPLIA